MTDSILSTLYCLYRVVLSEQEECKYFTIALSDIAEYPDLDHYLDSGIFHILSVYEINTPHYTTLTNLYFYSYRSRCPVTKQLIYTF